MPRKVFVAGEILTAADVNTNLMDQAVMVFDDAAARTTAIPTPSEGMVTYLKDTNAVEKYDGAAFVNVDTGKILQVVSVSKTNTFSASVAAGGKTAITDLSITHSIAQAGNKVLLLAQLGVSGSSSSSGAVGISFADNGSLINVGDAASNRSRVGTGLGGTQIDNIGNMGIALNMSFLYSPATGSRTYTVQISNHSNDTRTVFANRTGSDPDSSQQPRASSTFTLMEVAG